ncbi:MAG TPA: nucleotidyltransferase family protein, partial [Mycobacteriales bacterium]
EPRRRATAGALVACVREHPLDQSVPELAWHVAQHGVAGVAEAARRHGVVGCLWTALRADGLAERDDATAVREQYRGNVGRYLRTLSDLELVDEVLGAAGATYLVVKGPVLAEHVYRRPDLRGSVDLDLVVAPRDFALALSSLEEAGCRVYEANWRLARQRMLGELRLFTPAGTVLDLHWSLFAELDVRQAFPASVDVLIRRARTVSLAGRAVRTLDELDTLTHLALHASLSGGHRLVWCKDIEQALLRGREDGWLDWDAVVNRAEQWNAGPALALMLARTRAVLGADVPEDVVGDLTSARGWRAATRLADRLAPVSRAGGGGSLARLVARSVRADGRSSLRELTRRGGAWLGHGARRHTPTVRNLFDPSDPESAAYPDGGSAGRAAYLDAVCRQPG